ncbi:MAG: hypothetical protein V4724_41225 [Pseudomonadota bacterium]
MKLIRKISLIRRQKDTTVHCEIELCEATGSTGRYLVNLRQGRTGEEWRDSTRTPQAVDLQTAETLFALALAERSTQGFADPASPTQAEASIVPTPTASNAPPGEIGTADIALLNQLEAGHWKRLKQDQRNRTIWRIGERRLYAAVPALVDLIARGDAMQDYCIAWAVGRCGDSGASVAMRELHARGSTDPVRRMALQAWLLLVDPATRAIHAEALVANWPAAQRAAWSGQDGTAIMAMLDGDDEWPSLTKSDWIEQLDQVALCQPMARRILLVHLQRVHLHAGTFRAVRHIYKAAELRADAELFGLLHQRFETTPPTDAATMVYIPRRYTSFAEEGARPDSTVAYGIRTRDYLRRRGWRTLRRLGEAADPGYIAMALGAINAMDDRSAGKQYMRAGRSYDPYSHWMLFNRMLRAHGPWRGNRSGRSWYQKPPIAPCDQRQEAFPQLWDAHPHALLRLMQQSRCAGVHTFAARALSDNADYCAQLSLDTIRELLQSPYPASAQFAFQVARRRFEPGMPTADWLIILIQSRLPEASQYALDCIIRDPMQSAADALLVATMLCSPVETIRRQGWMLCQCALSLPGQAEAIVMQLLDWLDNCGDIDSAESTVPLIAVDLLWTISNPLRAAAANAPHARLLALLDHRLAAVRLLACQWLTLHAAPAAMLPGARLLMLLQDADAAVRGQAVRLFGMLPDHVLATQTDLIVAFAVHPEAGVRRGIDEAIQRLAASDPAFRQSLLSVLLDSLFRSETGEGMHADAQAWIAGPLGQSPQLADPALLVRLLAARSKGAQQLGARLLTGFRADQFDVADWTSFGRNPDASVRQWAYAAFRAYPERVRAQLEQALRLFDSRFDDTREFASAFFSATCSRDDWTPLLLVNLCDHLDPAAQRFGRAMITTHFDVADVTEYMVKLSQHPSANMQLFVSAWLESASAGDAGKLQRLEPYFLSVLSQVNRGRVVKSRVQAFLREQASLSEDIAGFVSRLFARQVLTVAIADKAQYIEGLRAIQQRYPGLPAVMTIHAPPALPIAGKTR